MIRSRKRKPNAGATVDDSLSKVKKDPGNASTSVTTVTAKIQSSTVDPSNVVSLNNDREISSAEDIIEANSEHSLNRRSTRRNGTKTSEVVYADYVSEGDSSDFTDSDSGSDVDDFMENNSDSEVDDLVDRANCRTPLRVGRRTAPGEIDSGDIQISMQRNISTSVSKDAGLLDCDSGSEAANRMDRGSGSIVRPVKRNVSSSDNLFSVVVVRKKTPNSFVYHIPEDKSRCYHFYKKISLGREYLMCSMCDLRSVRTAGPTHNRKFSCCYMEKDPMLKHLPGCTPRLYADFMKKYSRVQVDDNNQQAGFLLEMVKKNEYVVLFILPGDLALAKFYRFSVRYARSSSGVLSVRCSKCMSLVRNDHNGTLTKTRPCTVEGFFDDPTLSHHPDCHTLLYNEYMHDFEIVDKDTAKKFFESTLRGGEVDDLMNTGSGSITRSGNGTVSSSDNLYPLAVLRKKTPNTFVYHLPNDNSRWYLFFVTRTGINLVYMKCLMCKLKSVRTAAPCCRKFSGRYMQKDPLLNHLPGCTPWLYADLLKKYRPVQVDDDDQQQSGFELGKLQKNVYSLLSLLPGNPALAKCYRFLVRSDNRRTNVAVLAVRCFTCTSLYIKDSASQRGKCVMKTRRCTVDGFFEDPTLSHHPERKPLLYNEYMKDFDIVDKETTKRIFESYHVNDNTDLNDSMPPRKKVLQSDDNDMDLTQNTINDLSTTHDDSVRSINSHSDTLEHEDAPDELHRSMANDHDVISTAVADNNINHEEVSMPPRKKVRFSEPLRAMKVMSKDDASSDSDDDDHKISAQNTLHNVSNIMYESEISFNVDADTSEYLHHEEAPESLIVPSKGDPSNMSLVDERTTRMQDIREASTGDFNDSVPTKAHMSEDEGNMVLTQNTINDPSPIFDESTISIDVNADTVKVTPHGENAYMVLSRRSDFCWSTVLEHTSKVTGVAGTNAEVATVEPHDVKPDIDSSLIIPISKPTNQPIPSSQTDPKVATEASDVKPTVNSPAACLTPATVEADVKPDPDIEIIFVKATPVETGDRTKSTINSCFSYSFDTFFFSEDDIRVSCKGRLVTVEMTRAAPSIGVPSATLRYALELPASVQLESIQTTWQPAILILTANRTV